MSGPTSTLLLMTAILTALAGGAAAQQSEPVDKDIQLNIVDERITEANFERSTAVDLAGGDVRLRVGVGISAGQIDVRLRGITGHVTFRSSLGTALERLRQRLNSTPTKN